MSALKVLAGWASSATPSLLGAELLRDHSASASLEETLVNVASELDRERFLVISSREAGEEEICRAVDAFAAAGGTARICIAGHRSDLARLARSSIDSSRVGLMLDEAGLSTSCSDLIWDRLEAVRFSSGLLSTAWKDLRVACALEAMLGLAREVGLRTFAPDCVDNESMLANDWKFDYIRAR